MDCVPLSRCAIWCLVEVIETKVSAVEWATRLGDDFTFTSTSVSRYTALRDAESALTLTQFRLSVCHTGDPVLNGPHSTIMMSVVISQFVGSPCV